MTFFMPPPFPFAIPIALDLRDALAHELLKFDGRVDDALNVVDVALHLAALLFRAVNFCGANLSIRVEALELGVLRERGDDLIRRVKLVHLRPQPVDARDHAIHPRLILQVIANFLEQRHCLAGDLLDRERLVQTIVQARATLGQAIKVQSMMNRRIHPKRLGAELLDRLREGHRRCAALQDTALGGVDDPRCSLQNRARTAGDK